MGEHTGIKWTDHTFSGWWGCVKVSPACANCYAERDSNRWGFEVWGADAPRKISGDKYWNEPLRWNKKAAEAGVMRRVFSASMSDVFEDRRDLDPHRERLWNLIEKTPNLIWLLLSKRPESWNLLPTKWQTKTPDRVWLGVTAESQDWLEKRATYLKDAPSKIKFISVEPMLGPIVLGPHAAYIDWVIVGAESGRNPRPMNPAWVKNLRDECIDKGIKFFYKQELIDGKIVSTPPLDGKVWVEVPAL